jgi:mono/diheme cytochrome c family protein
MPPTKLSYRVNPVLVALAALAWAVLACSPLTSDAGSPDEAADSDEPLPADVQTTFDRLPPGDAARGEQVFDGEQCRACHVEHPVGPGFPGDPPLATAAATRRPDYPADLYLYESIVAPSAYVVEGYEEGVMPDSYAQTLTQQEQADLVAYLMAMQ